MRKGLNESILLQGLKEWIGQIAGLAEAHQILLPRVSSWFNHYCVRFWRVADEVL